MKEGRRVGSTGARMGEIGLGEEKVADAGYGTVLCPLGSMSGRLSN